MSKERFVAPRHCLAKIGVLLLAVVALPAIAMAQADNPAPKAEVFAGYSWFNPGGAVNELQTSPNGVQINSVNARTLDKGFGFAATFNAKSLFGVTVDYSGHFRSTLDVHTFTAGPQVKFRLGPIQPFAHILAGAARISPDGLESQWQAMLGGGGGIDAQINPHWGLRLIQYDYFYTNYNYPTNASSRWDAGRIQAGFIANFGSREPAVPPSAACAVQPSSLMAGEPLSATATPSNFNPKRTLTYTWSSTGGKVNGNAQTVSIDTTGMAPGSYTVKAAISDGKKGAADCSASFTINEPPKHPPTISCSANPASVIAGDAVNFTCEGNSPDGRPLTYTHTTSAGKLTPNGANVTLDTTGLPKSQVTVTSTVSDDRNLTASTTTTANVDVPPPPPTSSKLNEITFPDTKKPARVDNAAKAILDDVALRLQREPDAKAVVVGYATADETKKKTNKNLAAQRAVNTKAYLTEEKGIDPARIEVRSGSDDQNKAEIWIVPAGASFAGENTTVVDETKIKPQARVAPAPVRKKKAPAAQ